MAEKKSWRDKDRDKDKSAHRREEIPRGRAPRVETATATYKRQLDAFFDRGVVPEGVRDKLPASASGEGSERQKQVRAIREAKTPKDLEKAVDALLAASEMPDDMELVLRILEHSKDSVLLPALAQVEAFLDSGKPLPRKKLFLERLKGLEFTSFDPRVQMKSQALVGRLV